MTVILKKNCLQKRIIHGFWVLKDFTTRPPKLTKKTPVKIIINPKSFLFLDKLLLIYLIKMVKTKLYLGIRQL